MSLDDRNHTILSSIRSVAQYQSHAPLRQFSDSELRAAYEHDQTARGLARTLKCGAATIRHHARRLGLRLRGTDRIVWTPDQDALVRQCGRGLVSMATITRTTKHTSASIRERAAELGVTLVIREQGVQGLTPDRYSSQYENPITVGKVDKLLLKLQQEFGSPRTEVYPGVLVKV